jgi:hypothetical protein
MNGSSNRAHNRSTHPTGSDGDVQTIGEGSVGPSARSVDEANREVCAAQKAAYSARGRGEDSGIRETRDYLNAFMQHGA